MASEILFLELLRECFAQEVLDATDKRTEYIWMLLFRDVDIEIEYLESLVDGQEALYQEALHSGGDNGSNAGS